MAEKPDFSKFGLTTGGIIDDLSQEDLSEDEQHVLKIITDAALLLEPPLKTHIFNKSFFSPSKIGRVLGELEQNELVRKVKVGDLLNNISDHFTRYPFLSSIHKKYVGSGTGKKRGQREVWFPNHDGLFDILRSHRTELIKKIAETSEEPWLRVEHFSKALGFTPGATRKRLNQLCGKMFERRTVIIHKIGGGLHHEYRLKK